MQKTIENLQLTKNGYHNIYREDIKKIITSKERYGEGGGQALSGCSTVKFIINLTRGKVIKKRFRTQPS